jgi:hypothetical protein
MTSLFAAVILLFSFSVTASDAISLFEKGLKTQESLLQFVQARTCPPHQITEECQRPLTARELSQLKTLMREMEAWRREAFDVMLPAIDQLKNRSIEVTSGETFSILETRRWRGLSREYFWKVVYAPHSIETQTFTQHVRLVTSFRVMLFDQFFRIAQALSETPRLRRVMEFDLPEGSLLQKTYGLAMKRETWDGTLRTLTYLSTEKNLRAGRSLNREESYFENYLEQSFTAQRMRERDHETFMKQALKLARDLKRTRFTERLNRLMGRLSQIFGNTAGRVQTRSGKLKSMAKDPATMTAIKNELKPLDILLEKTPFRLTDYFIPGFYGHVALWLGTPHEWGSWPVMHQGKQIPLIIHPLVLELMPLLTENKLVLEALRIPGVTLNTIEHFMDIDDLLILRSPGLTQNGEMILQALEQYGKPYDFNFDVETQRELVCSELVYVVYDQEDWPTERSFGRYTIGPDQVAWKVFDQRLEIQKIYHDGRLVPTGQLEKLRELLELPGGISAFR